jgi:hypothetical protein
MKITTLNFVPREQLDSCVVHFVESKTLCSPCLPKNDVNSHRKKKLIRRFLCFPRAKPHKFVFLANSMNTRDFEDEIKNLVVERFEFVFSDMTFMWVSYN